MVFKSRLDKPEGSGAGKAEPATGQEMDQEILKGPPTHYFLWFL